MRVIGVALVVATAATVVSAQTVRVWRPVTFELVGVELPNPGETRCGEHHRERMRDMMFVLEQQDITVIVRESRQLRALHRMYATCAGAEVDR
jgi:hypothetical protein